VNALDGGIFDCIANTTAEVNSVSYLAVARSCVKYWGSSVRLSSQCVTHKSFINLGASTGQLILSSLLGRPMASNSPWSAQVSSNLPNCRLS
jgi:hypothetical protein